MPGKRFLRGDIGIRFCRVVVGWGHVVTDKDGLSLGDSITQDQADMFLFNDLDKWESFVIDNVKVELSDNQFAALVSLSYNCGENPILHLQLGKLLNEGKLDDASQHILLYNKNSTGEVLAGLTRRRQAEYDLFNS